MKFRARLGPSESDDKAVRILNRVVQWTSEGVLYEADQRHAELIVSELGLSNLSKSVNTPSQKSDRKAEDVLDTQDASLYRAIVARANYLAQDRADIGFAVKELCRSMSNPSRTDWEALKRLGRYLIPMTRVISKFSYRPTPQNIDITVDTDHAGCLQTRKSTSGGIAMLGQHCIKTWSTNQQVIALSSGEAEFYGIVKGASIALGIAGMLDDMDCKVKVAIATDSSAAKGIGSRRGLGKVRHIELSELWVQDQVSRGRIELVKIKGEDNFSDSLTKHSNQERIRQTLVCASQYVAEGRHPIMPKVAK